MQVKVTITAGELLDRWMWIEFCAMRGLNEWAVKEGRMPRDEQFTLTMEEARQLGLFPA